MLSAGAMVKMGPVPSSAKPWATVSLFTTVRSSTSFTRSCTTLFNGSNTDVSLKAKKGKVEPLTVVKVPRLIYRVRLTVAAWRTAY